MRSTSEPKVKYSIMKVDPRRLRRLPSGIPAIEAWIKSMGGHKTTREEMARLKRVGCWGMPEE